MNNFWILAAISVVSALIMLGIDYSNSQRDKKSKNALLTGYAIVVAGALFAAWLLDSIPPVIVHGAALLALTFFGRYLIRKAASRRV